MIDKKLLMNSIKAETDELADQRVKIHKDCMNNLRYELFSGYNG